MLAIPGGDRLQAGSYKGNGAHGAPLQNTVLDQSHAHSHALFPFPLAHARGYGKACQLARSSRDLLHRTIAGGFRLVVATAGHGEFTIFIRFGQRGKMIELEPGEEAFGQLQQPIQVAGFDQI